MSARRALVVVAHTDDETLGGGATFAKLAHHGWTVDVVVVADGLLTMRGTVQDNRDGTRDACALLGLGTPMFLGFPDQRFDTVAVADIARSISALDLDVDIVFTHDEGDLNGDHRIVADAVKVATRPGVTRTSLIGVEVPGTSTWRGAPFAPNLYVDVTEHLDRKVEAFLRYPTEQKTAGSPQSAEGIRALARYHGMNSGLEQAEAFRILRAYPDRLF